MKTRINLQQMNPTTQKTDRKLWFLNSQTTQGKHKPHVQDPKVLGFVLRVGVYHPDHAIGRNLSTLWHAQWLGTSAYTGLHSSNLLPMLVAGCLDGMGIRKITRQTLQDWDQGNGTGN